MYLYYPCYSSQSLRFFPVIKLIFRPKFFISLRLIRFEVSPTLNTSIFLPSVKFNNTRYFKQLVGTESLASIATSTFLTLENGKLSSLSKKSVLLVLVVTCSVFPSIVIVLKKEPKTSLFVAFFFTTIDFIPPFSIIVCVYSVDSSPYNMLWCFNFRPLLLHF